MASSASWTPQAQGNTWWQDPTEAQGNEWWQDSTEAKENERWHQGKEWWHSIQTRWGSEVWRNSNEAEEEQWRRSRKRDRWQQDAMEADDKQWWANKRPLNRSWASQLPEGEPVTREVRTQPNATYEFGRDEILNLIWPLGVKGMNAMIAGFWDGMQVMARNLGCKVSHHTRKSLRNHEHGWGRYSLAIMGPHRAEIYNCIIEKLAEVGADLGYHPLPTACAAADAEPMHDAASQEELANIFASKEKDPDNTSTYT